VEVCGEYKAKQCHLHHRAIFLQSIHFINSHILKFQPHYVTPAFDSGMLQGIMFTMLCQRQRVELLTEVSGGSLINHSSLITGVTTVFEGLILFTSVLGDRSHFHWILRLQSTSYRQCRPSNVLLCFQSLYISKTRIHPSLKYLC